METPRQENLLTEALPHFPDVQIISELGGRMNRHWLVDWRGEQKVLRRWAPQPRESIAYERSLIQLLAESRWPVAPFDEFVEIESSTWSLCPYLAGSPSAYSGSEELIGRGRLLAQFHAVTKSLPGIQQRPGWQRCEDILADESIDVILAANEQERSEEVGILRWHLDRARQRIDGLNLRDRLSIPVHGDFTPWNLLFEGDHLSGVIDFELARNDHRIADFNLSWRGKYDALIHAYHEVSPLEPEEWEMIVPSWWAMLIWDACQDMKNGRKDDGWGITKLLCRTELMGQDWKAVP